MGRKAEGRLTHYVFRPVGERRWAAYVRHGKTDDAPAGKTYLGRWHTEDEAHTACAHFIETGEKPDPKHAGRPKGSLDVLPRKRAERFGMPVQRVRTAHRLDDASLTPAQRARAMEARLETLRRVYARMQT